MNQTIDVGMHESVLPDIQATPPAPTIVERALKTLGIVVVIALGLFLRLWILGRNPMNEINGIVGVMALDILHGHFFTFFWGQNYGGVEPYVVAAMFAIFGHSAFTLGLTPIVLCAVAAILVWRVGRRLFGPSIGIGAGLLFWIWPELFVYESTEEYGFRYVTMICGLSVMLLALRISDRDELAHGEGGSITPVAPASGSALVRGLEWAAFGLFAGIGWWSSPEVIYYVLPAAVFVAWRLLKRRIALRPSFLALFVVGAIVGALPWLWTNAKSHLASFRYNPPQPDPSYRTHLSNFFGHTLPMMLGLRPRLTPTTLTSGWVIADRHLLSTTVIGVVAYVAVLVGIVVWMTVLVRRREALLLVGAAVLVPLAYAISPFAWDWMDGRYGLVADPIYTLLVASAAYAAFARVGKPRLGEPLVIVVGLALTLSSLIQLAPYTRLPGDASRSGLLTWHADPNPGVVSLAKALESAHIKDVWSSYFLSWELEFEAPGGRITSSDVRDTRYLPLYGDMVAAKSAAWLFVEPSNAQVVGNALNIAPNHINPGCLETDFAPGTPTLCINPGSFEAFLTHKGITYRVVSLGLMMAVEPSKPIPANVLTALHHFVPTSTAFGTGDPPAH